MVQDTIGDEWSENWIEYDPSDLTDPFSVENFLRESVMTAFESDDVDAEIQRSALVFAKVFSGGDVFFTLNGDITKNPKFRKDIAERFGIDPDAQGDEDTLKMIYYAMIRCINDKVAPAAAGKGDGMADWNIDLAVGFSASLLVGLVDVTHPL